MENIKIWLSDADKTNICARSLAKSLYKTPLTIYFSGELGTGKTTFVKGFGHELGIQPEEITSPTFALEQRYKTGSGFGFGFDNIGLLHIDLYRLDLKEAQELIESSCDFNGIRCIEWSERIPEKEKHEPHIDITISEPKLARGEARLEGRPEHRTLSISFHDIDIPTMDQIESWREDVGLPDHIRTHCAVVGDFAHECANHLTQYGICVRPQAVKIAGYLHDLLRFVDFSDEELTPEWKKWKMLYPKGTKHERACALFLEEKEYPDIAKIVEAHGPKFFDIQNPTIEQSILSYADKRVRFDTVTSLQERFDDIKERYKHLYTSEQCDQWQEKSQRLEEQIFPEGPPS
jgi:tRNA threonylcarbamoyladenosine biosynthesis protein TsaE